ncbi:MAG TPA: Na+/H+ antiporter NhaC [Woeseiaceae bacterium]|nr:Na+/H+ antiporter NhaC [Woeseiaceae bacterium]
MSASTAGVRPPSMLQSIAPIAVLVVLLASSVWLFGSDSSGGANQMALIFAAAAGAIIAVRNGHAWRDVERAIIDGIGTAMGAMMILLAVGALIGTWLAAGTVPAMIYYGLELLHPKFFYAAACLICAVASLATGSSWTVAGTLGVGLIGVAIGFGVSPAITAGAVVSGAYFGDKMSPLSDTTNLAPAVAGTDLFTHIRHMVWTTAPSFTAALVLFAIVGFNVSIGSESSSLTLMMDTLESSFAITPFALLPLVVVLAMASMKLPPLPTILTGAVLGAVLAFILQPDKLVTLAGDPALATPVAAFKGAWAALATGYVASTGVAEVDDLLSRGGMASMLNTIWLIISALAFGAVLEHAGMLERLIRSALAAAKSAGSLILATALTCIGANIVASDQYMAIVLPGRMFKAEFARRGLSARNLSRVIEDCGTLTSPLVPWNTCGAYMSAALGVATFAYLPFAFFNLINPVVSVLYGLFDIKIHRMPPDDPRRTPVPAVDPKLA